MELENLDYNKLISYLSGEVILQLGEGRGVRSIVHYIVSTTLLWKDEQKKQKLLKLQEE